MLVANFNALRRAGIPNPMKFTSVGRGYRVAYGSNLSAWGNASWCVRKDSETHVLNLFFSEEEVLEFLMKEELL